MSGLRKKDSELQQIVEEKLEERLAEGRQKIKKEIREELKQEFVEEKLSERDTGNGKNDVSRRDFLKKLGMGAAGIGALSLTPAASKMRITSENLFRNGNPVLGDSNVSNPVTQDLDLNGYQVSNASSIGTDKISNKNYVEPQAVASAGTSYTADLSKGNYHKITMTGDVTIDFTNTDSSNTNSVTLHLVQDSTGGRSPSFTPTVAWSGGSAPSWSTSAGAEDIVTLVHDPDGGKWLGFTGGLDMK